MRRMLLLFIGVGRERFKITLALIPTSLNYAVLFENSLSISELDPQPYICGLTSVLSVVANQGLQTSSFIWQ